MHRFRSSAHAVHMHRVARAYKVAHCAHCHWPQGHLRNSMALAPILALCKGGTSRALHITNLYSPDYAAIEWMCNA